MPLTLVPDPVPLARSGGITIPRARSRRVFFLFFFDRFDAWVGERLEVPVRMSIDFCWHKAAECHRLAGLDDSVQNFFIRSRNSWIELANRLNVVGDRYERPTLELVLWCG